VGRRGQILAAACACAVPTLVPAGCGGGTHATATRPHATATRPHATATRPHATATATRSAAAVNRSAIARAQTTHEYPSPPPPPESVTGGASSPVQAVRRFATAYVNWDAETVAADMRALAAQSVGQARSAMTLAAAQTADDYELRRGGIANSGTVEAVAPLSGHPHEYVVVTRESTSATNTTAYEGLRPAWHLALATVVEQRAESWVLTGWQPEN
jgi:hypothetical protein